MAETADAILVARASDGDINAYEQLVRRYQRRIFRMCLNMLGNEADAAEVAQDVFFSVWRALSKFRGEGAFSTWLYRIAMNRCLKVLRQRHPATVPLIDRAGSSGDPAGEYEARQAAEHIGRAVAALTPEQRAPLLLREVEGLSYEEIARILGLSIGAVKGRLNRARAELAMALEAHNE
jgi:RNA polymerase sigma-70 factor (ECF subfamily)